MNLRKFVAAVSVSGLLALLTACAASNSAAPAAAPTAANLAGNWLLAGSLPIISSVSTSAGGNGMTATFDVVGSNVTGAVTFMNTCNVGTSSYTYSTQTALTGTVASNGSFELQTPVSSLSVALNLTIQGTIPASPGAVWNGAFIYTFSSIGSPCSTATSGSGTISATSIPLVNGTYTGTAASLLNPLAPITVITALKQGGTLTGSSGSYSSVLPLSGSITVTGSTCLTSGTATTSSSGFTTNPLVTSPSGAVEGNSTFAFYQMNDGSVIAFEGSIAATDDSKIIGSFATLQAGTCNANFVSGTTTLVKT